MLLLNRGVFGGSTIMFESGGVPEEAFPLALGGVAGWRRGDDVPVRGGRGRLRS